jgi:hypothetical protein
MYLRFWAIYSIYVFQVFVNSSTYIDSLLSLVVENMEMKENTRIFQQNPIESSEGPPG